MAQYQNMNQFNQTPTKGMVANKPNATTLACQITADSANTFYPGTIVKLIDGTSETILIEKAAATDPCFGAVIFSPKRSSWTAGMTVEVALPGSIMHMESSEAINRGQRVEQVASGDKVAQYDGSNVTCGIALDKVTAENKLMRVLISTMAEYSSSSSSSCSSSSCSSSSSSSSA